MTRAELAEALEVERFTIHPRAELTTDDVRGWTPEQQAEHRAALLDALSDDPVVVAWAERGAA